MHSGHDILTTPLTVSTNGGVMTVMNVRGAVPEEMGAAFTFDGLYNTIDAEIIALGDSGKGPNRPCIVRHGSYTAWGFWGDADNMTVVGKALFINTCHYATKHANSKVLERMMNRTRDDLYATNPDRPYVRIDRSDHRLLVFDSYLTSLGVANHKKASIQQLITNLPNASALACLEYYTCITTYGTNAGQWQAWYDENKDYIWFSDTDEFKWMIDHDAKTQGIPTATLRGWSSENIDYKP